MCLQLRSCPASLRQHMRMRSIDVINLCNNVKMIFRLSCARNTKTLGTTLDSWGLYLSKPRIDIILYLYWYTKTPLSPLIIVYFFLIGGAALYG